MAAFPRSSPSTSCRTTSSISSRNSRRRCTACRSSRSTAFAAVLQRARKLHAGRPLPARRSARIAQLLRRRGLQLDRHPVGRRRRQGARGLDRARPPADGSVGCRSSPHDAVPAQLRAICTIAPSRALGLLYAMHWPFRQVETARGVRRSPCMTALRRAAPVSARSPDGSDRTGTRRRASSRSTSIPMAARTGSSTRPPSTARRARPSRLFDQSSFAKFLLAGADAEAVLNRICANRIAGIPVGQDRLHAVAQRARRDRGRPHRHADRRARVPDRDLRRDARRATSPG